MLKTIRDWLLSHQLPHCHQCELQLKAFFVVLFIKQIIGRCRLSADNRCTSIIDNTQTLVTHPPSQSVCHCLCFHQLFFHTLNSTNQNQKYRAEPNVRPPGAASPTGRPFGGWNFAPKNATREYDTIRHDRWFALASCQFNLAHEPKEN